MQVKEDPEAAMNIKQAETMLGTLRFFSLPVSMFSFFSTDNFWAKFSSTETVRNFQQNRQNSVNCIQKDLTTKQCDLYYL